MKIQQLTVGMMNVCCYIVSCEKTGKAVVIDPGGDEKDILAACAKNKLDVLRIISTHGHADHVCGNGPIQQATGAKIVMHRADAEFFSNPDVKSYFSMLGLPESPPPDILLEDGDVISFGEESLHVLHTPGHTPGGVSLVVDGRVFAGDCLFLGSIGRTDFPGGNTAQLLASIKNRLLALPDETVVHSGHGPDTTIGHERRHNPFLYSL